MDKDRANAQLRYGIKILKGKACIESFERALSDAIALERTLRGDGWPWQADRLQNWINKARQLKTFIPDGRKPKFTAHTAVCDDSQGDLREHSSFTLSGCM